ncbi:MAG: carbohydrate porin [Bacteroidales bacterium]|nr:carbohydrate porin [Bacteroidales bacterium]
MSPFNFGGEYTGDLSANISGGIKRGSAYMGLVSFGIGFDTEKSKLWRGGSFYLQVGNTHGDTPSDNLIGDFQIASNIEAGNHTYLQELWYANQISNLKIIIGVQDLNSELASSEQAGLYRHSSFGTPSSISSNIPAPVFPLTSMGFTTNWHFLENWNWISAIYDGAPIDFDHNPHNLSWTIDQHGGYLWFNELDKKNIFSQTYDGVLKIGTYYQHHQLSVEELQSRVKAEDFGIYAILDQLIKNPIGKSKIGLFTQFSYTPLAVNMNYYYVGGGLNFYGIGSRSEDVVGLALASAGFRDNKHSETVFELTYKGVLGENIYLQPVFQYILHPSGTEMELKDVLLTSFRFGVHF